MLSKEKEEELVVLYERKIRWGFPSGEVRSELLQKGYSEIEVNSIIDQLHQLSINKGKERDKRFHYIHAFWLILFGAIMYRLTGKTGLWIISSGVIRLGYELYKKWESEDRSQQVEA